MNTTTQPATLAFFTSSNGKRIDPDSTCTIDGVTQPVPERGLAGYRVAPMRMWAALAQRGYEPATDHYSDMRVVAGGVEMDIRPLTFTLYKSAGDAVYVGVGNRVWDLGTTVGEGEFATLCAQWLAEECMDLQWSPAAEVSATTTADGLTAVATYDRFAGVRLLVEREHLGATQAHFLGRACPHAVTRD